jgi:hypothetical protein
VLEGCLNTHLLPTLWQVVQVAALWRAGREWHEAQLPEDGCVKLQPELREWHVVHALDVAR